MCCCVALHLTYTAALSAFFVCAPNAVYPKPKKIVLPADKYIKLTLERIPMLRDELGAWIVF